MVMVAVEDAAKLLHASLRARPTPEAVASMVMAAIGPQLTGPQYRVLKRAADAPAASYSSMSDDFEGPVPPTHKLRMFAAAVGADVDKVLDVAGDPVRLRGELLILAPFVGWRPGVDFKGRMNRAERYDAGLGQLSRRRYNRIVRMASGLLAYVDRMDQIERLRQLQRLGRSGLAQQITLAEMRADIDGACFVAYWVANRNRRRAFTLQGRDSPFDAIAMMLLGRCLGRQDDTDWWMVARAYPTPEIVAMLPVQQRGQLAGMWMAHMRAAAALLQDLYERFPGGVDRTRMIVQRGMDSSTWNTVAQAFNNARAGWLNCLAALGALDLIDVACPGKVMRLMAGDLAAYHRGVGGGVDPDTRVWATLPLPWEVLAGDATCSRQTVELACAEQGVDPTARGWTAPRQVGAPSDWKPTPELVHGIEVADPLWAGVLRRAGVFSGKGIRAGHEDIGGCPTCVTPHAGA